VEDELIDLFETLSEEKQQMFLDFLMRLIPDDEGERAETAQ